MIRSRLFEIIGYPYCPVIDVAYVSDNTIVATCWDGQMRTWRADGSTDSVSATTAHTTPRIYYLHALICSVDPNIYVVETDNRTTYLCNSKLGTLNTIKDADIHLVAFSRDGQTLAIHNDNVDRNLSQISLYDVSSRRHTRVLLAVQRYETSCIAFSPDGKTLVAGRNCGGITLYSVASGHHLWSIKQNDYGFCGFVACIVFSNNGASIVAGSSDGAIAICDAATGQRKREIIDAHNGYYINCVAFSGDDRLLASCAQDLRICVFNDVGLVYRLHGHNDYMRRVVFSPNGRTVASCSNDASIRVWVLLESKRFCAIGLALLERDVAPYVALDIADLLFAESVCTTFTIWSQFMHFDKITMLAQLQHALHTHR